MLLKTPLISLKKNLHLPKFVGALYNEAFSVQIVKKFYDDFRYYRGSMHSLFYNEFAKSRAMRAMLANVPKACLHFTFTCQRAN